MRIGIIAGNRLLPITCAQAVKKKFKDAKITAVCFKQETSPAIVKYADKIYWLKVGELAKLREVIKSEDLQEWVMAGQITPARIFKRRDWDEELISLIKSVEDLRPHNIFRKIIEYLEGEGVKFLDSTIYMKEYLTQAGEMTGLNLNGDIKEDIEFGVKVISRYAELDIGQTIVVKKKSVVAAEALEGTDRTISRASKLAGKGCTVLKFSKVNQDSRFDVPVVGISTLKLLRKIKAASLVLEKEKTLILEKEKFLSLARTWKIPIIGK